MYEEGQFEVWKVKMNSQPPLFKNIDKYDDELQRMQKQELLETTKKKNSNIKKIIKLPVTIKNKLKENWNSHKKETFSNLVENVKKKKNKVKENIANYLVDMMEKVIDYEYSNMAFVTNENIPLENKRK